MRQADLSAGQSREQKVERSNELKVERATIVFSALSLNSQLKATLNFLDGDKSPAKSADKSAHSK